MKNEEKRKDNIYIVFISANTLLGKTARNLTGYPYTHIAVCLNWKLAKFYTFSRRKRYSPFDAGFMTELRCHYLFENDKNIKTLVYKVPIDVKTAKEFIKEIKNDNSYLFNYFGMILSPVMGGIKINKSYNCMSFTAHLLEKCGIELPKPYWKMRIQDIEKVLERYEKYNITLTSDGMKDKRYARKTNLVLAPFYFFKLTAQLLKRMASKT